MKKAVSVIVALFVAAALVIAVGIGSSWFKNWKVKTWFNDWGKKTVQSAIPDNTDKTQESDGSVIVLENDKDCHTIPLTDT